ncbi:beta-phosphoglucomutase family hydrolase [Streptomyces sp. ODS05-4]|uniref:HAD family hydrolase n=1 Tax=Streptomyces sp. ODS05-4 TaxID=2944939 RepID=UPI00210ABA5F|nr:beta-phosphoglucomutase family hydrolase [Streptomyces sp. ODS05-4]
MSRGLDGVRAVVFDTDGVITDSARLHAAAWQSAFDDWLAAHPPADPAGRAPFDPVADYGRYVDGKSRLDWAAAFLTARAPGTAPADIEAVAADKERRYTALLRERGADAFPGTVLLLRELRRTRTPLAAASASRHARAVLASAHVLGLFDALVDGVESARLGLPGKPRPDLFLEAARRLGTPPGQCAVVEDATAGVEAARRGGFRLVVGVDRTPDRALTDDLRAHGADLVVPDLSALLPRRPGEPRPHHQGAPR